MWRSLAQPSLSSGPSTGWRLRSALPPLEFPRGRVLLNLMLCAGCGSQSLAVLACNGRLEFTVTSRLLRLVVGGAQLRRQHRAFLLWRAGPQVSDGGCHHSLVRFVARPLGWWSFLHLTRCARNGQVVLVGHGY